MSIDRDDRKIIGYVIALFVVFGLSITFNWRTYSFLANVAVSLTESVAFLIAYALVSKVFLPDPDEAGGQDGRTKGANLR